MRRRRKRLLQIFKGLGRNFGLYLLLTVWLSVLGVMIGWVDPSVIADVGVPGGYLPFVVVVGINCWLIAYLFWRNWQFPSILSSLVSVGLELYLIDLLTIFNVLLLLLIGGVFGYLLFKKRGEESKKSNEGAINQKESPAGFKQGEIL